ncbi:MAG TPA: response regulator [Chitinophagales bacterium]|nr:response regulator [Chitinophagales bacterium]
MNKLDCVLLVDDDEICNFLNENVIRLMDGNLKVQNALNSQTAMDFVLARKSDSPLLILLDLNMPVMDGFEFLDEFIHLPEKKRNNIVIVILTSSDYEKDRERARKYNVVSGYVIKPLTHEKMVSIVETCFMEK